MWSKSGQMTFNSACCLINYPRPIVRKCLKNGLTLDICSRYLEARLESARGLLRKYPNDHVCSIACWVLVSHTNDTRRIWDHSKKLENRRGRTKRQSHRSRPSSMCALEAPNLAKNHLRIPQLEKQKKRASNTGNVAYSHCLKITQNVAFEFLAFSTIFVQSKLTCLVAVFDPKPQVFKKSPKLTIFGI